MCLIGRKEVAEEIGGQVEGEVNHLSGGISILFPTPYVHYLKITSTCTYCQLSIVINDESCVRAYTNTHSSTHGDDLT